MIVGATHMQLAGGLWSKAKLRLDQSITQKVWAEALTGRQHVTQWPWRTIEGASGDRILQPDADSRPPIVVLDSVSGEVLPAAALEKDEARPVDAGGTAKGGSVPALLKALSTGDRITIATADGKIVNFRVAGPGIISADAAKDIAAKPAGSSGKAVALIALVLAHDNTSTGAPVYYVIEAVGPANGSELAPEHQL